MPAPYTGRCACGSVTATITGEPMGIRLCWCRQCQQIAAGSATTNALLLTADVALTGELASHSYTAASGNTLNQYYCPRCGTPVYGQSSAYPHRMALRLGFLDEGHGLKPDAVIWLNDAPEWAVIDPAMDQYPKQAPPPPAIA